MLTYCNLAFFYIHLRRKKMGKRGLTVKFWGVRGSLPVPGASTVQYGGNTPCVELRINNRLIILDAGTGLHPFGKQLASPDHNLQADIFITHTHWDHIQGIPFFTPFYQAGNRFNIYGPDQAESSLAETIAHQLKPAYFPVSLSQMQAEILFHSLTAEQELELTPSITVKTMPNHHPGGGLSYRFDSAGLSCCYLTDMEYTPANLAVIKNFIQDASLLIFDSTFTDEEYQNQYTGYGHSTWQEGIRLARAANVKELVLFHHASFRTDAELNLIKSEAQKLFPPTQVAREGMVINL